MIAKDFEKKGKRNNKKESKPHLRFRFFFIGNILMKILLSNNK